MARFNAEQVIKILGIEMRADMADGGEDFNVACRIAINMIEEAQHYKDLAEQGRLVDIETYQQRLIRYIDAGKYRSADKKVFSENDVVYLIEHGIFPCKSEAEQALAERKKNENIKNT